MQQETPRRTNKERTETTRAALIAAARSLFVEKGYSETGTPEIVAAANVTRGALYHHFADKADLFRAVVEREARAVADEIEQGSALRDSPFEALMAGAEAYFAAMTAPGRAHLLLHGGPAVLGPAEMNRIDRETGGESLRTGLAAAFDQDTLSADRLDALTDILSAAFDRAALAIAQGGDADHYKAATKRLLKGILASNPA